jgi:hypothetical protein
MSCGDYLSRPADQSSKAYTSICNGYFQENAVTRALWNAFIAYFYILYSNEAHSWADSRICMLSPRGIEEAAVHLGASHLCQKFSQPLERAWIPTRNEHLAARYMLLRSLFAIAHFAWITTINVRWRSLAKQWVYYLNDCGDFGLKRSDLI